MKAQSKTSPSLPALVILTLACSSLGGGAFAQSASCPPDFAAIHDFKIGDLFQRTLSATRPGAGDIASKTFLKYSIVSKSQAGDTLTYGIKGLALVQEFSGGQETGRTPREIDSTLTYVDSASHSLNGCHGDIVPVYRPGKPGEDYDTRIKIVTGNTNLFRLAKDSTRLKALGIGGVGWKIDDTTLAALQDYDYETVFAAGLGLARSTEGGWASWRYEVLGGYVKDGDTVGAIATDAEMGASVSIRHQARTALPNRTRGFRMEDGLYSGFDLRGRRLRPALLPPRPASK